MPKTRSSARRIAAALLFTILPSAVALPAWSQDDPVTTQARARFKEGVDAFDKGKYEEARLAFLQAYALKKHPSVLLNLAQSSAKANHPLEAAKYFQQFLKESTTATPQQKKDAESGLAEVRQKIARIDVDAPAGTDISLDDQGKVGTTPMEALDVEPGQHTVKSPTQSVTVTAVVGQKVQAKLGTPAPAVTPVTPPPTPATDTAPPPPPPADEDRSKHSSSVFSRPDSMAPVYIGLGAAGVGLVGAIVFAAFKSDAQSKADTTANTIRTTATTRGLPAQGICNDPNHPEFTPTCKTLRDNNKNVDSDATIANISLAVMGVGLVVAGVWYLAGPKRDDAPPSKSARLPKAPVLTPWATWNGGGLGISGEL